MLTAYRLELTIWFIPFLIENAVAVSLVGMMLGPMYPIVMSQSGRVIPRKVRARFSVINVDSPRPQATYRLHRLDIRLRWRRLCCRAIHDRGPSQ
jgi:hypothetical protein